MLSNEDKQVLELQSQGVLQDLSQKFGMSIGLAVLDPERAEIEVIAHSEGEGVAVHLEKNFRCSLHVAAPGKAIVAFLQPDDRQRVLNLVKFAKHTDNTITDAEVLESELDRALADGYAVDRSEGFDGVNCVAVPVFGRDDGIVAGLWVTGFSNRLGEDDFKSAAKVLRPGADRLQRMLTADQDNNSLAQSVIEDSTKYIDEHFRQPIDLEQLAGGYNVKYSWFRNHFKQIVGIPPKQYVLQARMTEAQNLLANTKMSIKKIAADLGYESQNYFSAAFKRRFGHYPTEARDK